MNRARAKRLGTDLTAGAVLGGLVFLAARALGLWQVFGWNGLEAFWVAVVIGALLYATPLRPLLWVMAAAFVLAIALVAFTPFIARPAHAFVRADPPARPVAAVAVLASDISYDALISPEAVDRLLSGIALARAAPSEQHPRGLPLVLTVVTRGRDPVLTSERDQQRILELAGGGVDVHWTDPVRSTRDEARAVAAVARAQGWDRVAVVTSPLHTRRACATFERAGVAVRCVPADAREFAARALRTSRDRLRAAQLVIYETAGMVYYKLRGWV